MKNLIFVFFVLLAFEGQGQVLDTAAVRLEVEGLRQKCKSLIKEGKYEEALQIIQNVEQRCLIAFGEQSELYTNCLHEHGIIYYYQGKFSDVEVFWLKGKSIIENTIGKKNVKYAARLNNLAVLYWKMGKYKEAEPFHLETINIRKAILGEEHSNYAASINNLAGLYYNMSKYEKAENLYLVALSIKLKTLGKNDVSYAGSLGNLGLLYNEMGRYEAAERLLLEAKSLNKEILGEEHVGYSTSLSNLAFLYGVMGQYKKAEQLSLEAISITERILGIEHPDYLISLENLASTYTNLNNYKEAESIYINILDIRERILGKEHPEYSFILYNLGNMYLKMGQYKKAENFLLEAKIIREKVLGKNHSAYAQGLTSLGNLYSKKGIYEKASNFFHEAKNIRENILGKEHLAYAESLYNLVFFYSDLNNYDEIEDLQLELYKNQETQITSVFSFFSEEEKAKFIKTQIRPNITQIQSSAIHINSPNFQDQQYDIALLMKGIQLQTSKNTLEYILQQQDSVVLNNYYDLLGIRRSLAKQYELPIDKRQDITELEAEQETLEKSLARASATFRKEQAATNITQKEVKVALKTGEAAIEFVHFNYKNPDPTDSVLYAAAVLLPNAEHAQFIPLFEVKQLDSLLQSSEGNQETFLTQIYEARGLTPKQKNRLSEQVYQLVWKPLDSLLVGVQTVYYSPSGLLHRLNLPAIPISKKQRVGDKYKMYQLSSTRQIALRDFERESSNQNALILGGIHYDTDTTAMLVTDTMSYDITNTTGVGFQYADRRAIDRGTSWGYLKGTAKEANDIHALLKKSNFDSYLLTKEAATEEAIKNIGTQANSPRVLHLATHGFFFPDPVDTFKHRRDEPIFKLSEHPMIRSGLILAGANRVWEGKDALPSKEDGILTAYEISQMNLTNTELVVLSACETGLGDIKGNEGVFGLQRAFKMAGAKYLIMSLWKVPDVETQELMTLFYQKWLEEKMEIPEAFRSAQQEMKRKYDNPYLWAGFVLVE